MGSKKTLAVDSKRSDIGNTPVVVTAVARIVREHHEMAEALARIEEALVVLLQKIRAARSVEEAR